MKKEFGERFNKWYNDQNFDTIESYENRTPRNEIKIKGGCLVICIIIFISLVVYFFVKS